ncbi:MAG TPA: hypothetical protein VFS08_01945 [Gemmatimonadaceae bacterium]|nr:hypothetical protein [Gemmatimonadaceae bacterium]
MLVCAYEDLDAERVVVDELSDLDDAVACCRDLVESEGYPRAEVWSGAGRAIFVVMRDEDAIFESDEPDEAALLESPAPSHEPQVAHARRPEARRPAGHGEERAATNGTTGTNGVNGTEGAVPADGIAAPSDGGVVPPASPADLAKPNGLLGEQPGRGERWFGL